MLSPFRLFGARTLHVPRTQVCDKTFSTTLSLRTAHGLTKPNERRIDVDPETPGQPFLQGLARLLRRLGLAILGPPPQVS